MRREDNIHAGCVVIGDRGILITGQSGSGKSTLALTLVAQFRGSGAFARLVADDRTLLGERSGRIIARPPASIAGLAEAHGLGPRPVAHEQAAVVDLVVDLAPREAAPRLGDGATRVLIGCTLPLLVLPEHNIEGAVLAIAACLGLPPFRRDVS